MFSSTYNQFAIKRNISLVLMVSSLLAILSACSAGVGSPTFIPSPTFMPPSYPPDTQSPTRTPAPTVTLTATLLEEPGLSETGKQTPSDETGIGHNTDWTPHIEEINGVKMAMVPAGCFVMGSTDEQLDHVCEEEDGTKPCEREWFEDAERPEHRVCFDKPFWIDIYEVTQAQFARFGGEAAEKSFFTGDNLPQESITRTEAEAFCQKRGTRLPTEAQWEYAARGPDGLEYPWGNEFVADNLVYSENSGDHTWDVGSKPGGVSWIGAYDLSGNVWEWVMDWYGAYSSEQQVAPTGPESGDARVLRGGSWYDSASWLRTTSRNVSLPHDRGSIGGFRCGQ